MITKKNHYDHINMNSSFYSAEKPNAQKNRSPNRTPVEFVACYLS